MRTDAEKQELIERAKQNVDCGKCLVIAYRRYKGLGYTNYAVLEKHLNTHGK